MSPSLVTIYDLCFVSVLRNGPRGHMTYRTPMCPCCTVHDMPDARAWSVLVKHFIIAISIKAFSFGAFQPLPLFFDDIDFSRKNQVSCSLMERATWILAAFSVFLLTGQLHLAGIVRVFNLALFPLLITLQRKFYFWPTLLPPFDFPFLASWILSFVCSFQSVHA